jgi:hypothetical protein
VGAGVLATGFTSSARAVVPEIPDPTTWVTDGSVYSISRSDDRIFIGGDFSHVAERTGGGVSVAPVAASGAGRPSPPIGSFPEVTGGHVAAAVAADDGSWYIGGDFDYVGGISRARLARFVPTASGELVLDSSFAPRVAGTVRALALGAVAGKDAGVLYVGGKFTSVNDDFDHRNLAALDRNDGNPVAVLSSPDNTVRSIDVLRQHTAGTAFPLVFIGGEFVNVGGTVKLGLAALWGAGVEKAGEVASGFAHTPGSLSVRAVHVGEARWDPGRAAIGAPVYVGGDFGLATYRVTVSANGNEGSGTIVGQSTPTFQCAGCSPTLHALTTSPDGETLYVGGRFDSMNGGAAPLRNLVAIDASPDVHGAAPTFSVRPWRPAPDGPVLALGRFGNDVYAGGDFTQLDDAGAGAVRRSGVAAIAASLSDELNDAQLRKWNPSPTGGVAGSPGVVTAIGVRSDGVYVGGSFTGLGGSPHENVAALTLNGILDDGWSASVDGPVYALAAAHGRLYVGGNFTAVNDRPHARLAAVAASGRGAVDGTFRADALPSCADPDCAAVFSLAMIDTTLYVGGLFSSLGGGARANAAAVDAASGALRPGWSPDPDGSVYSLLATCRTVYAGGAFSTAGGQPRSRLAAFDPITGRATTWDPAVAGGTVYALAADANLVYVGGRFTQVGGRSRENLAAIDASTGVATGWNPGVPGIGDLVRAVAVPATGDTVYAGGRFSAAGRAERANIAAFNRTDGDASAWNPGASGPVRALSADTGSLLVGGEFRQAGTVMQHGFGSFGLAAATSRQVIECARPATVPPPPADQTAPPPPVPTLASRPGPARDTTPPQLHDVRLSRVRFRTARPAARSRHAHRARRAPIGTNLRYRLSDPAVVRLRFSRAVRANCSRGPTTRLCFRWREMGAIRHLSSPGDSTLRFDGRVGRRWLRRGSYRLSVRATDLAANRSRATQ